MMGCNELAIPGGMVFGFDPMNIVRSVENVFYGRSEDIVKAGDFESSYNIYEEELFKDLWQAEKISKGSCKQLIFGRMYRKCKKLHTRWPVEIYC